MDKLKGKSMDLVNYNIEKLKELFPEVVVEGKIDYEKLQLILGGNIEIKDERYEFTWNGKSNAIKIANKPSTGTLRPDKTSSKNWDTTGNLYIEGDNLEVLKLLQKSYFNKVKMIYIDPPYNTGNDFVYMDDFRDNIQNYKEITSQTAKSNAETSGRYHTDWLNMMYPRLRLARNLLREDGVIFISIDDNEVHNLRKVCDEVFGEENFVALLPTIMNLKGNNDQFGFAGTHEYTLVYNKNYEIGEFGYLPVDDEKINDWETDELGYFKKGANLKATGVNAPREKRPNLFFPLYITKDNKVLTCREGDDDKGIYPITDGKEMSWRWSKEKFNKEPFNIIVTHEGNNISIYKKTRALDGDKPTQKPKSIFYKPEYSSGNGTNEIKKLFSEKIFSNPKPTSLLVDFIRIGVYSKTENQIILDFFSGSSTTAHAVMQLNAEDGGNRKYIMVQLPELCDEDSEAYKAGYNNICEIGKERIRRAGEKIIEENKNRKSIENLDIGFKVFKLDNSNIKEWDVDEENLEITLQNLINSVKEDRKPLDILYEVLIKLGLDLNSPVEEKEILNKKIFSVGMGYLIASFDENIRLDLINEIGKMKPEIVVFLDRSFENDVVKTNAYQRLKKYGIKEIKSI